MRVYAVVHWLNRPPRMYPMRAEFLSFSAALRQYEMHREHGDEVELVVTDLIDPAPAPARIEAACACHVDPLRWNKRRKCWLPPLETYDLLPGTHCHKCGAYLCHGFSLPHPMTREALEAAAKAAEEVGDGG
jgi:hypothetical protein